MIEKEARERRLMAYSDRIQNRMMEASSEIIDELVAERHRQDVTQQELADMTGILPSNLARFEKAEKFAGGLTPETANKSFMKNL